MFKYLKSLFSRKTPQVTPEDTPLVRAQDEFQQKISDLRKSISRRNWFTIWPSSLRENKEKIAELDKISGAYYRNSSGIEVEEKMELIGSFQEAIKEFTHNKTSSKEIKEKTDQIISKHKEKHIRQTKPNFLEVSPSFKEREITPRVKAPNLARKTYEKVGTLVTNFQGQNYNELIKQGFAGSFLQERLNQEEFEIIKAKLQEFVQNPENLKRMQAGIASKGFFSLAKGEIDPNISEHTETLQGLPRSVVFTEHNGEMELTILTKSKIAGNAEEKDGNSKFVGGNTVASRAVSFATIGDSAGLSLSTIVHKTPHKRAERAGYKDRKVTDNWYRQASTDPLDAARRAPNGMFVEDGGQSPIIGRNDKFYLDPKLREKRPEIIRGLMKKASQLESVHGDIKLSNILVHPDTGVRIIDFPADVTTQREEIKKASHFVEGFVAKDFVELAAAARNLESKVLVETTSGISSLRFAKAYDDHTEQWQACITDIPLTKILGIDEELDAGLLRNQERINLLNDVFFVNGHTTDILPQYHDGWAVLNAAEDLYLEQQDELTFKEGVELEIIRESKRQMLQDLVQNADKLPEEQIAEIAAARNNVEYLSSYLDVIKNVLINDQIDDQGKQSELKKKIINMSVMAPDGVDLREVSAELLENKDLNVQEFVEKTQGLMQEIIAEKDRQSARIETALEGEEFQNFTKQMNEKWSPKAVAIKMGVKESLQQDLSHEIELIHDLDIAVQNTKEGRGSISPRTVYDVDDLEKHESRGR